VSTEPERLLAEALRAQAAQTPVPSTEPTRFTAAPGLGLAGSGYGLLSGTDVAPRPVPTARLDEAPETAQAEPARGTPVLAILVLALVLGLAAGAVVGLLTLL
jgi:hypothetical protein